MNRDSNVYTFTFATLMVFVVASVLAYTSFSLKDLQNENVRKEKMQNILSTVGIQTDREGAEKLFNQYVVIISMKAVKKSNVKLQDLKSRLDSFIDLGIDLPTDDLLRVIITKSFSDKQIKVNVKILEYILKNIDRSYEKIFKLIKEIDEASLSTGKSININLIKKVLKNE